MQKKDNEVQEQMLEIKEILPGVVITIFSIFIFFSSFSLQGLTMNTIGSDFLPKIISLLAFLGSVIINVPIVRGLIKNRKRNMDIATNRNTQQANLDKSIKKHTTLITLGVFTIYILIMSTLGFLISTSLYLFVQILLLAPKEKRKPIIIGIISIVLSSAIYIVFRYGFTIVLPEGILG